MICVEHDGGIFEKPRQLGGMQVSMHAAVMRADWELCTVCDDRLRPRRPRETGLPDWQLRQHLRWWNLPVSVLWNSLSSTSLSFFSPILSTTTTTTTSPHNPFLFLYFFFFFLFFLPPFFFFSSLFLIFGRSVEKTNKHIYNYTMVKVRLFCWWCCVCCIVLLTLWSFAVVFLRARHDHNKIAPCGMIKVFLYWIELKLQNADTWCVSQRRLRYFALYWN